MKSSEPFYSRTSSPRVIPLSAVSSDLLVQLCRGLTVTFSTLINLTYKDTAGTSTQTTDTTLWKYPTTSTRPVFKTLLKLKYVISKVKVLKVFLINSTVHAVYLFLSFLFEAVVHCVVTLRKSSRF